MELKELKAKRARLAEEIRSLADAEHITASQDQHLSRLVRGLDKVDAEIKEATDKVRSTVTHKDAGVPTYWRQTSSRDVFETESRDNTERSELAKRAADFVETETGFEVRSDVVAHFDKTPGYADFFRATASPDYSSAWAKILLHGEAAAMLKMSDAERSAVARVAQVERRDMNVGTDSAGGYAVPVAVDAASIMLNNTGSVTNLRNLARVVTAVSDQWRGLASTGVTASFVAEGVEVGDNSPTLVGPTITAHKAAAFVPYTFEVAEDWPDMLTAMRALLADAKERLEAEKFLYGTGTNEPYGLLTRLEANTAADVVVTTSGTIGAVDIYNLLADLPPRFRPNASWLSSMTVLNRIRQINTDGTLGTYVADMRAGYNFSLLGRPVYEASDMDAMVGTTAAATFACVGDFSRSYTVFDRLGSARISPVAHLFGSNSRPIGASGVYFWFRTGGDCLTGSTSGEQGARILVNKTS
jgi:HK97 family phage major capsid protein